MPFGKTMRRLVAYISMGNGFDIEVGYINFIIIKYLKFPTCDYLLAESWVGTNTTNFRSSSS